MLASTDDDNYAGTVPVESSIREVMKLTQAELRDLLARREEIAWRIRHLRQVADGVESVPSQPAFDRTTSERFAGRSLPQVRRGSNRAQLRLTRACRIALMEERTASPKEIYCRIVRRGSFSFANSEFAIPAIVGVLNAMTDDGEVRCFEDGQGCRWSLVLREEEVSMPL